MTVLIAVGAVLVGLFIGLVGIGGVFLVPLLVFASGMPIEEAIGTSLLTFVFTAIVATIIYVRNGNVDWRMALIASAGSVVFGLIGARVSVALPAVAVKAIFAAFLLFVGANTLLGERFNSREQKFRPPEEFGNATIAGWGAIAGFGSGLVGVGGPAILVPLLMYVRVPMQLAVGVSQVDQIAAAASGAAGHLLFGHVDLRLAAVLTVLEVTGAILGAVVSQRMNPARLRSIAAGFCLAVGIWTLARLFS
ncbi:MAG: sulfite exporter TauE/SafE family protein [Chloroflexota bacterium]